MKAMMEKRLSCQKAPLMQAMIDKSAIATDKTKAGKLVRLANCNLDLDLDRPEIISASFLRSSLSYSET